MSDLTITAANSVYTLTVPRLAIVTTLQDFSADAMFMTDDVEVAEVQMGADGRMTAGYVFNATSQTITFLADSESKRVFSDIMQIMLRDREVFYFNATITLPSIGETFTLTRGILQSGKMLPDAGRVLNPVAYKVLWQRIDKSII